MDPTNITDPSACASPDGASLPTPTPAAGVQTERPVMLDVDWPSYATVGQKSKARLGSATVEIGGKVVTVGLAWDAGGTDQPYVHRHDGATTADEDDAIERAVGLVWAVRS